MKLLFVVFITASTLFSNSQLIIDSNHFEADDKKGIAIFTGNVKVTKIQDKLNAQKLELEMMINEEQERIPKKYTATGSVDFLVYAQENIYVGKGEKVVYEPLNNQYIIIGNGYLEEKNDGRILYGEEIYLDEISGKAEVIGNENKPVRFIMNIKGKE